MNRFRWIATRAPLAGRYDDIWFVSADVGWAVSGNGEILKTEDGAITWSDPPQFRDPRVYFRSISMTSDGKIGWAGTTTPDKRLYKTTDGMSWRLVEQLPSEAPSAICGLWVLDAEHMYASGTNYPERPARFLKTEDGGRTWFARDMEDKATLLVDIYFENDRTGWVVGGRATKERPRRNDVVPTVLKTDDGGQTWNDVLGDLNVPLGEWGWKIQFLSDGFGVVACENLGAGAVLFTEDGGETWTRREIRDAWGTLVNQNLEGIGFLDRNTGWVGGWGDPMFDSGRTSQTTDGGLTWTDLTHDWPDPLDSLPCPDLRPRGQYINRFRFIDGVGYASGNTVYKWTDQQTMDPERSELASSQLLSSAELFLDDRGLKVPISVPSGARSLAVVIYDRFSGKVRSLHEETAPEQGLKSLHWDLCDDNGRKLPAGQFLVRVTCDGVAESRLAFARRNWTEQPLSAGAPHVLRGSE